MRLLTRMHQARRMLRIGSLKLGRWPCPVCDGRLQIRLVRDEIGIRCLACAATPITQSIVGVIRTEVPALASASVYELSSRGALVDWLTGRCASLTISEYLPGVEPGASSDGVRCEDVQRLTFADDSFDLCTSTEVFEHVLDDHAGFAEVRRVLKPGGSFVFTVPFCGLATTLERVAMRDGELVHLLEPEYHGDPYAPARNVLCMRNYGDDILGRLTAAGFSDARFVRPASTMMGYARAVVVATR
jgi:SAM-dependent methyltransferase